MKKDFKSEDLLTFSSLSYTGNESVDAFVHTTGGSLYIDDLNEPNGMLHGYVFYIPVAHAKITSIDLSKALNCSSVHRILTAKDIPGENQIGGFIKDEALLAEGGVHYWGQPLALILAEDLREAKKAAKLIEVVYEPLNVIVDPREAVKKNSFLIPPKTIIRGEVEQVFGACDHVIEGTATSGGQEHLYLEGQGALAIPRENGLLKIYSSTQGPTIVQSVIARVLNIKMHQIEVEVGRLGGGFGGKEDQATPWATLAALACLLSQKPVKIVLDRSDDMRMTGKRHPYEYDYKIGLNHAAKILAYEITFYQNGGSAADLSPAVLSRSIFHACNAYHIPNIKITAYSCKTNLPPNTAFRGFGAPQAIFAVECAIRKAAEKINVAPEVIQKENLLKDGDCFHYGQKVERSLLGKCWEQLESDFNVDQMISKVKIFNQNNIMLKKGLAFVPVCFGVSFTKTSMNQASAIIHVYFDGSVCVHTAAVEMGQGVSTKITQLVQDIFGLNKDQIRIDQTNTSKIANTSPTAASTGTDLNGKATEIACLKLKKCLAEFALEILNLKTEDISNLTFVNNEIKIDGQKSGLSWKSLVSKAYENRISLTSHAHYSTPHINFDPNTFLGQPYSYHVYGVSLTEVTVDTLRGRFEIDGVYIIHDFGQSINTLVDGGQLEGALMQGIGWLTVEDLLYNQEGKPLTDTLSAYKIPDIKSAPKKVDFRFLKNSVNSHGVRGSKGVGEPPLIYGIGTFLAIREAMKEFRQNSFPEFIAPMTPERILSFLYLGPLS